MSLEPPRQQDPPLADAEAPLLAGASSTRDGRLTVNVLPWPSSLATVRSPPIIRQNLRLMARPRPVPPYLRVVEASAWPKASNNRPICSGVIPMPVSETEKTT